MTNYVFLWERPDGERCWEVVENAQGGGFLKKLVNEGVHPATVMVGCAPISIFHWVWKDFHNGLSDVNFRKINEEICGSERTTESRHKPVDVPVERETPTTKFGWLAPDGRFFGCDYGGHSHLADKIVGDIQYVPNPERHLEDFGWAKILKGSYPGKRYAVGMGLDKKLSDAQLKALSQLELDDAHGVSSLL